MGFDEPQHISFAAQIKATGNPWPPLDSLRLIDPKTFEFTATPNFLDHPPIYYALLAAIGPPLEGHPQAVFAYRMLNVSLAAIGLAALLMIALDTQFSRPEFWALAVPLAFIPVLVQLAAAVTNDNMAFLGGALATLGAWQTVATGRRRWLAVALGGVIVAAWAKLTGLVLTAPMISAVVAYMIWRKRAPLTWLAAAAFAFLLAAAPYFIFLIQYGSPVPPTHALLATVEEGVRNFGWANLPRKSFTGYLMYFSGEFIANWMPTLAERTAFQYAMLAIPVAALLCAAAGLIVSVRRVWRYEETKLDVIVIAGAAWPGDDCPLPRRLQLQLLRGDRLARRRLSALLPAACRNRAARRLIAGGGDQCAALAHGVADIFDRRPGHLSHPRRAGRLSAALPRRE